MTALKFKTPAILDKKVKAYFKHCDDKKKPYTVSGLALFIGTTRKTLIEYGKRETYSVIVRQARATVEAYIEEMSLTARNPTGCIFNLKANFGWKDKQEIEHTGSITFVIDKEAPGTL